MYSLLHTVGRCCDQARMKARPPLAAVSTPSTSVSVPPPPATTSYVVQGQNGVVSPPTPNYTVVSTATVGPLTTPKCAYQTLPAVQYIQHPVSNVFYSICIIFWLRLCVFLLWRHTHLTALCPGLPGELVPER